MIETESIIKDNGIIIDYHGAVYSKKYHRRKVIKLANTLFSEYKIGDFIKFTANFDENNNEYVVTVATYDFSSTPFSMGQFDIGQGMTQLAVSFIFFRVDGNIALLWE